jgi:hypothetical protein
MTFALRLALVLGEQWKKLKFMFCCVNLVCTEPDVIKGKLLVLGVHI